MWLESQRCWLTQSCENSRLAPYRVRKTDSQKHQIWHLKKKGKCRGQTFHFVCGRRANTVKSVSVNDSIRQCGTNNVLSESKKKPSLIPWGYCRKKRRKKSRDQVSMYEIRKKNYKKYNFNKSIKYHCNDKHVQQPVQKVLKCFFFKVCELNIFSLHYFCL